MIRARVGVLRGVGGWLILASFGCGAPPARDVVHRSESRFGAPAATPSAAPPRTDAAASGGASTTARPAAVAALGEHQGIVLPSAVPLPELRIPVGDVAQYAKWRQVGQTRVGKGYLYFLEAFAGGSRLLVKSAAEPDVRILDAKTRRESSRWPVVNLGEDEMHTVLPWRGSGESRVVVGKQDGLWLYAAESGQLLAQLAQHPVDRASWSDDGRLLVTATLAIPTQTAVLRVYQSEEDRLRPLAELPQTERVDAWALSRDNRFLARVFYPSDRVTVVDLHTGQALLDAPTQRYVGSVEFSPNGRWLVLGGEGVKLFDLSDTARRAEYSHFYNNVGDVEFSPSGDVLAVGSYDGQVRLLTYDVHENRFGLLRRFSHQKNTNVYTVKFIDGGNTLISSAGDQTVRYWAGPTQKSSSPAQEGWRSPADWAEWGKNGRVQTPGGGLDVHSVPLEGRVEAEHYIPARLSGPPASSRIKPGEYACKISTLYKLRRCSVLVDTSGHTLLEFDKENLLGLRGVLYDDGDVVRFEGWLTEGGGLGCANCGAQPLHAVFRGHGSNWQGLLLYKGHYDPQVNIEPPDSDVVIEEAIDRFPLMLQRK